MRVHVTLVYILGMNAEILLSKRQTLNSTLQTVEASTRLLQFVRILIQINKREKLVKYEPNNHRNTNYSS